jgi:DNA-binding transcriptional MerR regulator
MNCGVLLIVPMATQLAHARPLDTAPAIPDRLYFKIGDVARILDLETYVLRFWESQFPQLKPNKSGTGQRLYRRREVELVLEIKRLVHAEGYTLPGARHALEQQQRRSGAQDPGAQEPRQESRQEPQQNPPSRLATPSSAATQRMDAAAATVGHARAELREIAALLASPAPRPVRRRPRLATVSNPSDFLFPA